MIDKRKQPLCQANCPLGVNVQGYVALARVGKFAEALELIRRDNILPGICGRICTHPCELACRRGELDEPLAIRDIKRFVADHERANQTAAHDPARSSPVAAHSPLLVRGRRGSLPLRTWHAWGIRSPFSKRRQQPGGVLRYGIGPYRLPRDILDYEIEIIRNLGVRIRHGVARSTSRTGLDELKERVESSHPHHRRLGRPQAWSAGRRPPRRRRLPRTSRLVCTAKKSESFLKKSPSSATATAAFDVARALVRLGARGHPSLLVSGTSHSRQC